MVEMMTFFVIFVMVRFSNTTHCSAKTQPTLQLLVYFDEVEVYNPLGSRANKHKLVDKDCRFKRHEVRKLANQKHEDSSNNEIRTSYHKALKTIKKL